LRQFGLLQHQEPTRGLRGFFTPERLISSPVITYTADGVSNRLSPFLDARYRVIAVSEGALGTILAGASKLPLKKMESVMNQYGGEGWNMDFMVIEHKRFLLFWERESAILTFSRQI